MQLSTAVSAIDQQKAPRALSRAEVQRKLPERFDWAARGSAEHGEVRDRLGDITVAEVARLAAALVVFRLQRRELVVFQLQLGLLGIDAVEARVIEPEDCAFDRSSGGTERREAVFLLHFLWNLEPAQPLDLPLRPTGPHCVGAPAHPIDAHLL